MVRIGPARAFGRVAALALLALAAVSLGACGRRGALEPPPDPSALAKAPDDPTAPLGRTKVPPITPPQGAFILDPLL